MGRPRTWAAEPGGQTLQLIAVANESFRQEIGVLPEDLMAELQGRVRIILGL